ncbi:MAG: deoxyribonuclease IV [Phycisphaerales bacterium]|nr:deoxyribonuclease IV [Phycisphaerales bacterium]
MFGSHLSIAGGIFHAIEAAVDLKLDCVQVFTANQRQWNVRAPDPAAVTKWREALAGAWGTGPEPRAVAHDSYLINLASPDKELWNKSIRAMANEINRCADLGITRLVSHPGAHMGKGIDAGINRIADAYANVLGKTPDANVMVCLENTAGGGTTLGRTFEELAQLRDTLIARIGRAAHARFGFCLDTCHALAAGYDIAAREGEQGDGRKRSHAQGFELGRAMLDEFDDVCGLNHLQVIHMNDSKAPCGSRRDRHEHIAKGHVAPGAFAAVILCPHLANRWDGLGVPMILETPKGVDDRGRAWDTKNLQTLRRLVRISAPPTRPSRERKVALA